MHHADTASVDKCTNDHVALAHLSTLLLPLLPPLLLPLAFQKLLPCTIPMLMCSSSVCAATSCRYTCLAHNVSVR
jgi:hypothetical protein